MISIENVSRRRRCWRANSETVWVEPGETVTVEGELPPKHRVIAFASSGLALREVESTRPTWPVVRRRRGAPNASDRAPAAIPQDWQSMPWPVKRGLASRIVGKFVRTEAEAETIIKAEAERIGL